MSEDAPVNTGAVQWPDEGSAYYAVRRMQTKLHRWAGGILTRPTMQFRLHPPYRVVRRPFVRPLHGAGIHRRVFGHCRPSLLDTLPSFPMCTGFPWLGVLRRLRPIHTLRQASRLSVASHRAGRTTAERSRMVPTFTGIRSTG